jgi:ketosteroid isomerase-like protein
MASVESMLAAIKRHFAAECEQDVQKTLDTLTEDVTYEHPLQEDIILGKQAVKKYYEDRWAVNPLREVNLRRYWASGDDVLIVEADDISGLEGHTHRNVILAIFELHDGKVASEKIYISGWTPTSSAAAEAQRPA